MNAPLPKVIDLEFFKECAAGDPEEALRKWEQTRHRTDAAKLRDLLRICSGLSLASARNYLAEKTKALKPEHLDLLDWVSVTLGQHPRNPNRSAPSGSSRGQKNIALITQLAVPSETYHFNLVRGLVREARAHHFTLSVHEADPRDLTRSLARIKAMTHPDAFIFVRLTPKTEDTNLLRQRGEPLVLVHADRYNYPAPVLANIVPDQDKITTDLTHWLRESWCGRNTTVKRRGGKSAVVITMRRERTASNFLEASKQVIPSVRNERIDCVLAALTHMNPLVREVDNYMFNQALSVYQEHPDAPLYVCLSDQLAVGIKHLLIAAGKPWQHRVLGFDGSDLARVERIPSFSQDLDHVCRTAVDVLATHFTANKPKTTPRFSEVKIPVRLQDP